MQNAVPLNNPDEQRVLAEAQKRRADSKGRIAISRADVRKALGARYTPAAVVEDRGESGTIEASRLVYFSYSKNSTVEVTFEGQRVRGVKTTPAAEYQPEITGEEIVKAEGIARAHFAALGQNRVADLQAFGILAYKPNGKGFYATRVLYVSFHPDSDSPPEYLAWVDLSTQRVLRARLEAP